MPPWMTFVLQAAGLGLEVARLFVSKQPPEEKLRVVKKSREKAREVRQGGRITSNLTGQEIQK